VDKVGLDFTAVVPAVALESCFANAPCSRARIFITDRKKSGTRVAMHACKSYSAIAHPFFSLCILAIPSWSVLS